MSNLPERINVMRVVSYDVESIRRDAHNAGMPLDTVDDVLEFIEEWIEEDMTAPLSRHDLIFQDENGNEL